MQPLRREVPIGGFACLALLLFLPPLQAAFSATLIPNDGFSSSSIYGIRLDSGRNIVVVGSTTSSNLPVTNGSSNPGTQFSISTDHGLTWHPLSNLPSGEAYALVAASGNGQVFYAAGRNGVFKSVNGGVTWAKTAVVDRAFALAVDPSRPRIVYATAIAGIFQSIDAGATWTNIAVAIADPAHQLPPSYVVVDPFHPATLYTHVVAFDYRSFDGGKTWSTYTLTTQAGNGNPTAPAFDPLHSGVIYCMGNLGGLFRSIDNGQTWTRLNAPFLYAYTLTVDSSGRLWVRDQPSNLHRSDDQAATFKLIRAGATTESGLAIDPFNPAVILTDRVRTGDGGATWQPTTLGRIADQVVFDPGVAGRVIAMAQPSSDAFVAKLDPTGQTILFATYLGGLSDDFATSLAVDSAGGIYIAGGTSSADFPSTPGALRAAPATVSTAFVAKFDTNGNLLYATLLPGEHGVASRGIALDALGNAAILSLVLDDAGNLGCSVMKLSADGGSLLFAASTGLSQCRGIAYDAAGNLLVAGDTGPPSHATLLKLDSAGKMISSFSLSGSGSESVAAMTLDSDGNIYLAGNTVSKDFPVTPGAWQTSFTANCPYPTGYLGAGFASIPVYQNQNVFVVKLDPSGSPVIFSTYLGGNCNDTATGLAVDPGGNVWITGFTDSSTFPQVWPFGTPPAGQQYAGFAVRLAASGAWLWRSSYTSFTSAVAADAVGNAYLGAGTVLQLITAQPQ